MVVGIVVQKMKHVVMTENVPSHMTVYAVTKIFVLGMRYVVLMVHVSHLFLVHVVALVTVDLVKNVVMIIVFHQICVVKTQTVAQIWNVVMIISVVFQVNVAGLFTVPQGAVVGTVRAVHQAIAAARILCAVPQRKSAVLRVIVVFQTKSAVLRVSAVPQT